MKKRMIAMAAALMLAVTSLVSLAGAETAAASQTTPAIEETVLLPDDTAASAEKTTAAPVVAAYVKTHHRYTTVSQQFKVKVGKVSRLTKVCLWSTDCRKSCTMIRRLSAEETLTVVAQSNGWYKVVDSTGRTGFVVRSRVARA